MVEKCACNGHHPWPHRVGLWISAIRKNYADAGWKELAVEQQEAQTLPASSHPPGKMASLTWSRWVEVLEEWVKWCLDWWTPVVGWLLAYGQMFGPSRSYGWSKIDFGLKKITLPLNVSGDMVKGEIVFATICNEALLVEGRNYSVSAGEESACLLDV